MLRDLQQCLINEREKELFDKKQNFEDPFPKNI